MLSEPLDKEEISLKFSYWSALLLPDLYIVWIMCFTGIIIMTGSFAWEILALLTAAIVLTIWFRQKILNNSI